MFAFPVLRIEPRPLHQKIFEASLARFTRLILNLRSSCFSLLSSRDYRRVPAHSVELCVLMDIEGMAALLNSGAPEWKEAKYCTDMSQRRA